MKKILLYSALAGLAFVSAQSWAMEPHETTPEPSTQGHNYSFVKAFGLNNSFAGVTLGLISFENWQADVLSRESFPLAVQKEVELDDRSLSDDEKQKAAIENLRIGDELRRQYLFQFHRLPSCHRNSETVLWADRCNKQKTIRSAGPISASRAWAMPGGNWR